MLPKTYYKGKVITTFLVFILGFLFGLYQINTRPIYFNYKNYTNKYQKFESDLKKVQQQILGPKVYHLMESFDKKIPVNF